MQIVALSKNDNSGNSEGHQGATMIGGAPAVLDRRRATPFIGGAVCDCLIGSAESFWLWGLRGLVTAQQD